MSGQNGYNAPKAHKAFVHHTIDHYPDNSYSLLWDKEISICGRPRLRVMLYRTLHEDADCVYCTNVLYVIEIRNGKLSPYRHCMRIKLYSLTNAMRQLTLALGNICCKCKFKYKVVISVNISIDPSMKTKFIVVKSPLSCFLP